MKNNKLLQFFEAFRFVVRILKRLMELMERIEVASIGGFDYFFFYVEYWCYEDFWCCFLHRESGDCG